MDKAASLILQIFAAAHSLSRARFQSEAKRAFTARSQIPARETGSAFRFGKTDHDQRAGFGNLIKIREQLDLVMVRAQDVSLQRVISLLVASPGSVSVVSWPDAVILRSS
jgi:hypothetical protein